MGKINFIFLFRFLTDMLDIKNPSSIAPSDEYKMNPEAKINLELLGSNAESSNNYNSRNDADYGYKYNKNFDSSSLKNVDKDKDSIKDDLYSDKSFGSNEDSKLKRDNTNKNFLSSSLSTDLNLKSQLNTDSKESNSKSEEDDLDDYI